MLASAWVGAAAGQRVAVLAAVAWAWVTDAGWGAAQVEDLVGTNPLNEGVDQASAPSYFLDSQLFRLQSIRQRNTRNKTHGQVGREGNSHHHQGNKQILPSL
jgi:hypothetical protein